MGVDLAAYAVESVAGIGFDEHCAANIFEPLAMTDTSWHLAGLDVAAIRLRRLPVGGPADDRAAARPLLTNGNWDTSPDTLYWMQERLFAEATRF